MDFRQLFPAPDDLCESEYRAIYTTLAEVLPDAPPDERADVCQSILESYIQSAKYMLEIMRSKGEGRSE